MKILIADDSEITRLMLYHKLSEWGYEIEIANDGEEAWEILCQENPPTLAIIDWMMPNMDGITLCKKIRENIKEPYIYMIILTMRNKKNDLIESMEAGADDFVSKPFDADVLKVRLRAGIRILDLHNALISAREELRIQATYDQLTGLFNRRAIMDMFNREISRASRETSPIGVLMVDVDHFKKINDNYGHPAGDIVLKEAANRMKDSVRTYDSVGRFGGEEFLVILPKCGMNEVMIVAERLKKSISNQNFDLNNESIKVTISIGATNIIPDSIKIDQDFIIQLVDTALYKAKKNGRDRIEFSKS